MRQSRSRQSGFTLIEISVVVIILATISAMSLFAINQAFDRRYKSQADNLLVWLNQLSDQAALEAVPYGVMGNPDEPEKEVRALRSLPTTANIGFRLPIPNLFLWKRVLALSGLCPQVPITTMNPEMRTKILWFQ